MFIRTLLSGKVALVTGASSGLGVRFAKVLAQHGASVGLLARRSDRVEALAAEIEQEGGKAFAVAADVTHTSSLDAVLGRVEEALGPISVLVNNAGLARGVRRRPSSRLPPHTHVPPPAPRAVAVG